MTIRENATHLATASISLPTSHLGISIFPVYMQAGRLPEIRTGDRSGIEIEELVHAEVRTVAAYNPTDKLALVVEGQQLVGGKQDRALNASVLIPAETRLEIPVSCLEQGRWGPAQPYRQGKFFAPRKVRARKEEAVNATVRDSGSRRGDQAAVWDEVSGALSDAGARSDTLAATAVEDIYARSKARSEAADDLMCWPPSPSTCGFAVAHGTEIVAIELFGSRDLLDPHWYPLMRSYMVERVEARGQPFPTDVMAVLQHAISLQTHDSPGVGLGAERRILDENFVGQALTLGGSIVHASFFLRAARPELQLAGVGRPQTRRSAVPDPGLSGLAS